MTHSFKSSEIRVEKNKNGFWQTHLVAMQNGKKHNYVDWIPSKCSMFEAKKQFAENLNVVNLRNKNTGFNLSLHKDYYLKSKSRNKKGNKNERYKKTYKKR